MGSIEKRRHGREHDTTPSATLILNSHAVLMQILEVAVNDGLIRKNPAKGVKLSKKPGPVTEYPTQEQLNALVRESGPRGDIIAVG